MKKTLKKIFTVLLVTHEQAAAFGNVVPMPIFAFMANFFPLTGSLDQQNPAAGFVQSYMTSDKGVIEASEELKKQTVGVD